MMPSANETRLTGARMYRHHPQARSRAIPVVRSLVQNRLLAALPAGDDVRLRPMLEWVPLPRGMVLYEAGDSLRQVHFPVTGIVSVICVTRSGDTAEVAMVGNDGVVGIPLLLAAGESANSRAVVRCAGHGYRLTASDLLREFDRGEALVSILLGYTQAFMAHAMQTVSCVRHHTLDQRLCRWLLSSLDRMSSHELPITHEAIAESLGVRREGVTAAIQTLKQAGIVHCGHRRVTVQDRRNLELRTCGCYAALDKDAARPMSMARRDTASAAADGLLRFRERRMPAMQMSVL